MKKHCNNCDWHGMERKTKYKTTYHALKDEMVHLEYNKKVRVCNYNNPSEELNERVNPCSNYKSKN